MKNPNFYLNLENTFRGPRDEISERLKIYNGIIKKVSDICLKPKVLDIGSGRGEWLLNCKNCNELGSVDWIGEPIQVNLNKNIINYN